MTAKPAPKPATPDSAECPNLVIDGCYIVRDRDSQGRIVTRLDDTQFAYIAHAANSYPRLVEALRHIHGLADGKRQGD